MTPPFTEYDLKRLKEASANSRKCGIPIIRCAEDIDAILARLQAAEAYAEIAGDAITGENYHEQIRLLEAWRKSKGE